MNNIMNDNKLIQEYQNKLILKTIKRENRSEISKELQEEKSKITSFLILILLLLKFKIKINKR